MTAEHFQRELPLDPVDLRKIRLRLEQVDAATFEANRQLLARTVGRVDLRTFQKLALAAAEARGHWVSAAMHVADKTHAPSQEDVERLAQLRGAYEELSEAYSAMRRMVERGYLCFLDLTPA